MEKLRLPPKAMDRGHKRTFDSGLMIETSAILLVEETGGDVWLGGFALSRYFDQNPNLVVQKNVLELGTGTGFLSLCLALTGVARVTAT
jgi:predicted nicotinamide N-methyase